MMENTARDLHHALRSLRRAPGFSLAIIVTLGLAIGANAGIFSVVKTVLLDPLPLRETDRLVEILASAPGSDFPPLFGVSSEFYVHYRENSQLLEDVSTTNSFTSTLRVLDRVERVRMSAPTPSLFSTLGVIPILGRLPVADDEDVVVLSHALWRDWFGNDPKILDRTLTASGRERTIIGVMGADFWFPNDDTLLWHPQEIRADEVTPGRFGPSLVGRMKPGVTTEALEEELTFLARQLPDRFGGSSNYADLIGQHRAVAIPIEERLLGSVSGPLWALLGAVGLVLLIACANVANLLMVRAERRRRDLAIQRAMGANGAQLLRSQMAEVIVLSILAGIAAVVLAWASVPLIVKAAPSGIPRISEVGISASTLLFTFTLSVLTALGCGLIPALRAARTDPARLREAGRGTTRRKHWARNGLIVAQTALALVLLIGSGLLITSFWQLRSVDPGYDVSDVYTFQIAPDGANLTDAASFAQFHTSFMERVAALPGVQSVGLIENVPLNETVRTSRFRSEETGSDTTAGVQLGFTWAAGDYFRSMQIPLIEGRVLTQADHTTDLGNAVISRRAAELLWPGKSPIGRRFQIESTDTWETVVGVVGDVLQDNYRDPSQPTVYFPLVSQQVEPRPITSPGYVVKTARAEVIGPEIRALVKAVAPNAPMYRTYTMEGLAAESMMDLRFTMLTLGLAASLALFLGVVGLYGVISYVVADRTREIGLRMAIGAAPRRVQGMVLWQGTRVVLAGVAVGLIAAVGLTKSLAGLLYGVSTVDPATFAWTSAAMIVIGLIATYLPARRASLLDPIESMRSDA